MKLSRYHFDYDNMHVSIDCNTGDILELYNRKVGKLSEENLIKSSAEWIEKPNHFHPFTIKGRVNGEEKVFHNIKSLVAHENPEYRTKISSTESEDGLVIKIEFPYICEGENYIPVDLYYTIKLKGDTATFNLNYKNSFCDMVKDVRFPIIDGIWLGETHKDNVLVYPNHAGLKMENPVKNLCKNPDLISWRFLEYRYFYRFNTFGGENERLKEYDINGGISNRYPGEASMSYVDLYNKDGGFYFGCHDKNFKPVYMEVGSFGERFLGLVFALGFEPRTNQGEEYTTPDAVVYVHEGDWREGAKFYRNFRSSLVAKYDKPIKPEWMNDSAGLFCHYDFKNQQGDIVHTYKDLPRLGREAVDAGFKHIMLAGWHLDGFDRGYPMYTFDPELGTEQEFIDGIKACKDMGVHVTVYINIKMHADAYKKETISDKAVVNEKGEEVGLWFGNAHVKFTHMCPRSKGWQEDMLSSVRHVTQDYGIDGIYFDQLNCGNYACFNPRHDHEFNDIQIGYVDIIKKAREEYFEKFGKPLYVSGEWVIDRMGEVVTYQLNQSFFNIVNGAFPEMYRYTFPNHGIVDMIYPGKNLAMRPVHVAQKSQEFMAMMFTNGSYFWVYDWENDNTFKRDPEGYELLKELIALKKVWLELAPDYTYVEQDGITIDGNFRAGRFIKGEKCVVNVFKRDDSEGQIAIDFKAKKCFAYTIDGQKIRLKIKKGLVRLPSTKAAILFFE